MLNVVYFSHDNLTAAISPNTEKISININISTLYTNITFKVLMHRLETQKNILHLAKTSVFKLNKIKLFPHLKLTLFPPSLYFLLLTDNSLQAFIS